MENLPGNPTIWHPISFSNYQIDGLNKDDNKKGKHKINKKNNLSLFFKWIKSFFAKTAIFTNTFYV